MASSWSVVDGNANVSCQFFPFLVVYFLQIAFVNHELEINTTQSRHRALWSFGVCLGRFVHEGSQLNLYQFLFWRVLFPEKEQCSQYDCVKYGVHFIRLGTG